MDAGQTDKLSQYCAAGFKISNPFLAAPAPIEAFQSIIQSQKTAFPDMKHEVLEIVSDGKNVVTHGIYSGTNTGNMMGNPPTGNKVSLSFLVLDQVDGNGKITSRNVQFDSKSFEAQLMAGIDPVAMNKQAVLKIMESINKRDLDGVVAAYAPGAKFNGWAPQQLDAKGYKAVMGELLAAFPDSRFVVDDVVAEGDKVVVRHHFEGTHTGAAFQGVPPSKRKAYATATVTFLLKNGKPVELWLNADFLAILTQIGAIPMAQN
ncbi:MAG: ester cyclase [Saprospiraceae bacterium]|nr:ester cyclase [Saprospiraceae bacterium]